METENLTRRIANVINVWVLPDGTNDKYGYVISFIPGNGFIKIADKIGEYSEEKYLYSMLMVGMGYTYYQQDGGYSNDNTDEIEKAIDAIARKNEHDLFIHAIGIIRKHTTDCLEIIWTEKGYEEYRGKEYKLNFC